MPNDGCAAVSRRTVLASAVLASGCVSSSGDIYLTELLEREAGGRLGAFVLDMDSGIALSHRATEPFGMCSTFKLPLAAVILREADAGRLSLDERVPFTQADIVPHAPVTSQYLAQGWMTIGALAEAGQKTSDNVAANLLVRRLGGPEAFTAKVQAIYRHGFRLDRYEPDMNLVPSGELRDTATPEGMGLILANLFDPELAATRGLSTGSRETLAQWMVDTNTGLRRIRAGLPSDWRAGDKTGTALADGMPNKTNDVALVWPPRGGPVVIVGFYESPAAYDEIRAEDEAVLAEVGRLATLWIRRQRGL